MSLQESGENYLEAMLIVQQKNGYIRSVDVARQLSFSKPSVSRAVSILKRAGHITTTPKGIVLTESGEKIAKQIYERHQFLTRFLMAIGVSEQTAAADACRMEHVVSEETYRCFTDYVKKQGLFCREDSNE